MIATLSSVRVEDLELQVVYSRSDWSNWRRGAPERGGYYVFLRGFPGAGEGPSCGQITHVEPHCAACGEILRSADVDVEPGPGLAAASDDRSPEASTGSSPPR